jgi:hypothetical protein
MLAAASGAYAQTTTKTPTPFIGNFNTVTTGPSTVPANGDVNPYGTAVVPRGSRRPRDARRVSQHAGI